MHPIRLLQTSGVPQIDDILQGVIGIFEATFPNRIRSYYLVGSYASGTARSLSDIDLRVIFKHKFGPGEEERMLQIRQYCRLISPIALDCPPLSEHRLLSDTDWLHEPLGIQAGGVLLYGDDIREQWPPPDFAAYVRNVTAVPIFRFGHLRALPSPLRYPLTFPDPDGEFYGYAQVDAGTGIRSLKLWVHAVGFSATCIIALKAGQIVARKEDWLPMYRQYIHDRWTDWLEAIHRQAVQAWSYRVPAAAADRAYLRALCHQTLAFENDYLSLYRDYLMKELGAPDPVRNRAARTCLRAIVYPDLEVEPSR